MAVEGSLDLFRLPEILQVISQERKTGILTVQGAEDIVAVSFLRGRIVAADALNATTEEGLGAALVEQGRVPEEVLRRMAARAEAEGVRLADLLVQEGHLDREGLLEGLRVQTSRLLLSLLDWQRGEFKFYGGEEVSYEEGFRSIGVDELLITAVQERAEEEPHRVPELESRLRRVESARPVRVRSEPGLDGGAVTPDSDSAVWMTPAEHRVLEAVGPARTVEEVARLAEVPPDRARYVLYRFLREGLVAAVSAAGLRAPAARAAGTDPPVPARPSAPPQRPAPSEQAAPPRPAPARVRPAGRAAAAPDRSLGARLQSATLACLAAVLTLWVLALTSVAFLLPFPWMDAERAALHGERDAVRLLEIDQAAKTYFLLEGRFPDELAELVAMGLLEPADLLDSRGRHLAYEPRERRYLVRPIVAGVRSEAVDGFHEGIAGNFLLDPDFLAGSRAASGAEPPLVLLD